MKKLKKKKTTLSIKKRGVIKIRALITGICGQDGSYLAEFLLKKGYTVFGFTRLIESDENIKHIKDKIHLLYGDLSDQTSLLAAMKEADPDEVYNLGAISHVGFSFKQPLITGDVTGLGVTRILEAIKAYNPNIKFIQASSSEMFGKVLETPQNEKTQFNPQSPYAAAKVYGFWMTKMYRENYGLHASNSICYNHEGNRRGFNFVTRKISYGVAQIKAGLKNELILGDTSAKRDWGYAPEYVEIMWKILQQDKADDYVIGTGEIHSVQEFVEEAFKIAGLNHKDYVKQDPKLFRAGEVQTLCADSSKARKQLGWNPKIKFKQLVKIMVEHDMEMLKSERY